METSEIRGWRNGKRILEVNPQATHLAQSGAPIFPRKVIKILSFRLSWSLGSRVDDCVDGNNVPQYLCGSRNLNPTEVNVEMEVKVRSA